jgi:hypothetical protein
MHRTRTIVAIILIATGLVWIGQGTGILQGRSFMVGDPLWAIIGAACLVVGLAIGIAEVRRRRA